MITLVRRGLYVLTIFGILATAFELATERHWNGLEQFIPWVALGVLTVATSLSLLPSRGSRLLARLLALLVMGTSIYGIIDHVTVNYNSGPLDARFANTWESQSAIQRWWYAATKSVGPAPPLAPGVLAQTALLLLCASLLTPRPQPEDYTAHRRATPAG